jgi:sugar/nucleoside kinase (ribokinase family)
MYPDPQPPQNRTGAGDAMTSTVVVALALGLPLREALLWGPINSMSVVQYVGAQKGLLTREKIENYLANAPETYRVESF